MKSIYHNLTLFFPFLFPCLFWMDGQLLGSPVSTSFFQREEGRIAFFKMGNGKRNLILLPGLGDRKESYFELSLLLAKENSVYSFDLRGLGESDVSFSSYGPKETAEDVLAFIREKDLQNVYIIANSMTAASAVYIRSKEKNRVHGLLLSGPFVRDKEPLSLGMKTLIHLAFRGPWGPSAWASFYESLFPVHPPKDIKERSEKLKMNLKEDGRMAAVRSMMFASKKECEMVLPLASGNVIVVMGTKDPDFDSPQEEADWIANTLNGSIKLYEDAGHYPFVEDPSRFSNDVQLLWQKK
ncbi:alpha/beta hydrolase [Leptospira sp. 2 VSF19]|uniref:Alpha/beta hydrolase n=1 Tax=Leptospira soteropolitanensis TaxID=2950025 RepID=A0AAW5VM80_9LEPT|nr:alpha/beta hydrolase [Leptospira soteropolitanensis]MCW7493672.1 alpha/beta hydrolase [Leptospira soteropolitanensis]MCW7501270.1 alpha/beta hydrolase [Leptospira soteropolitanensis]MCW7523544.1 alpha/beta hydrolase [Leptospira soteropolitanensis]MCW7527384.1 alpha/beta hydrolase [Leptospira soteropolitanensis]MCW7531240.1 alpha/beta hydrolase [Leptospira soteropolitanensis]